MRLLILTTTVAGFSSFAFAQDISECLEKDNGVSRLACYDDFHGYEEVSPSAGNDAGETSKWSFFESADEFSGKNDSYVVLESDQADNRRTDAATALVVRCDGDGSNDIYAISGGYIGASNDRIPVRYKFEEGDPITERWIESTDGKAAFLPSGFQDFRSGLETGGAFLFEITDFRGSRYIANFPSTIRSDEFDFVWQGCR